MDEANQRDARMCKPIAILNASASERSTPTFEWKKEKGKCLGKMFIDTVDCDYHESEGACLEQKSEFGAPQCYWEDAP